MLFTCPNSLRSQCKQTWWEAGCERIDHRGNLEAASKLCLLIVCWRLFFSISISGRPDNDERLSVTSLEASVIRSVKRTESCNSSSRLWVLTAKLVCRYAIKRKIWSNTLTILYILEAGFEINTWKAPNVASKSCKVSLVKTILRVSVMISITGSALYSTNPVPTLCLCKKKSLWLFWGLLVIKQWVQGSPWMSGWTPNFCDCTDSSTQKFKQTFKKKYKRNVVSPAVCVHVQHNQSLRNTPWKKLGVEMGLQSGL